jgi:hypothetical protein
MFLFSNDLTPNGETRPLPSPCRLLSLPVFGKASYACADGMRNILMGRSIFERISQLGCAWGS